MNQGRARTPGLSALLLLLALSLSPLPVPLLTPGEAQARPAGVAMARTVVANWLAWTARHLGGFAGMREPAPGPSRTLSAGGRDLAYVFPVGQGQVVVAADDELWPILLASEGRAFPLDGTPLPPGAAASGNASVPGGLADASRWLTLLLRSATDLAPAFATAPSGRDPEPRASIREAWTLLGQDPSWFENGLTAYAARFGPGTVPPLVTSGWTQGPPYNADCPQFDAGRQPPAGATALALAQAMRLHAHPARGRGAVSYDVQTLGQSFTLRRDFSESVYAWPDMPDTLSPGSPEKARQAVSELVVDVGLALRAPYSHNASDVGLSGAAEAMRSYFGYREATALLDRAQYGTGPDWPARLAQDLSAGLPVILRLEARKPDDPAQPRPVTWIVDGQREGPALFHLHTGLGPGTGVWVSPDLLLAGSRAGDPAAQSALAGLAPPGLAPVLLSPLDLSTVIEAAPLFSWKPALDGDYTHYHLWIGRGNETLASDWMEAGAACAANLCAARPSVPFEAVGEYSWAVRGGREKAGPGPWSRQRTLFVAEPPAPKPLAPKGPQANLTVRFAWKGVPGAGGYRLQVLGPDRSVVQDQWRRTEEACPGPDCGLVLSGLPTGNATWTVQAQGAVEGPASQPLPFALLRPGVAPPVLRTPGPGRVVVAPQARYTWTATANATSYHLYVTGADGAKAYENWYEAENFCSRGNCTAQPGQSLPRLGRYFWKVRAVGPLGPGPWSATGNFTFFPTERPRPGQKAKPPPPPLDEDRGQGKAAPADVIALAWPISRPVPAPEARA